MTYVKSSFNASVDAVEVMAIKGHSGPVILVRKSSRMGTVPFAFSKNEWDAFVAGVKNGEFDYEMLIK